MSTSSILSTLSHLSVFMGYDEDRKEYHRTSGCYILIIYSLELGNRPTVKQINCPQIGYYTLSDQLSCLLNIVIFKFKMITSVMLK